MQIDLSVLIQNSALALLTIFIPIGIYIFSDKNSDLDKKIIIKDIVKGEIIFLSLVLIFLPLFFWKKDFVLWQEIIGYALILTGFLVLIRRIFLCYKWIIKDDKHDIRIKFIAKKNLEKSILFECWKFVWENKHNNITEENDFFNKFIATIDAYQSKKTLADLDVVLNLLDYFNNNIEKRNWSYIVNNSKNFSVILEWHMLIWERSYFYLTTTDSLELWSKYSNILQILNSIIQEIAKKALMSSFSFSFFETLKKHIDKYQELQKTKDNKNYLYAENFPLFKLSFENIGKSPDSHNIWNHYFPKNWKITTKNYKGGIFTRIMFHEYLEWMQNKIRQNIEGKFDNELDNTTYNLFPSVDPISFSDILFFLIKPWTENRVKDFLESKKPFGYCGRVFCSSYENSEDADKCFVEHHNNTIDETIALVCTIFSPKVFQNLDKFISDTEDLKESYSGNTMLESRRNDFLMLLRKIKQHTESKNGTKF